MSLPEYTIVSVDPLAERELEQMGSKEKFWYRAGEEKWLFKSCREGTGEDWAEKIAGEVATLLGLPHARYELAEAGGKRGSVCLDFAGNSDLIHGNELLWQIDQSYPVSRNWRVSAHTVSNVMRVISNPIRDLPTSGADVDKMFAEVFVGYLALDALIGNTDRHHENWGLLRRGNAVELAPTYDHASSLGRELRDEKRRELLKGKRVAEYALRARSALYAIESDKRPLSTHAAFLAASKRMPMSREAWLARIASISPHALEQIIHCVPSERITPDGRQFALQLMLKNQSILGEERSAS